MKRDRNLRGIMVLMVLVGSLSLLVGCGGGSSGETTQAVTGGTTTGSNGIIEGTVVKGPVNGGMVMAYAVSNGTMGMQLASGTTDSQGNFTISIGDYSGAVMLQMSGGTYMDEATGATVTMYPGDVMTAVIPSVSSGVSVTGMQVTPLTSMAQAIAHNMAGGMTAANITTANTTIGNYFMVSDILHTSPMNPLVPGSGTGVTEGMKNYGMAMAALSQYANDMGMSFSSGMVTAMMNDASDGVMDGMMGNTSITMGGGMMGGTTMPSTAGTSGLAGALTTFMGSTMNHSGLTLTDMQMLMDQLNASSGQLPGAGGTTMNGTVGGTAFNGSVADTTVMAFAIDNGTMGAQLASCTTDTQGNFTMSVGSYSGPVMLQMSNGTFTDLATGMMVTISSTTMMTAVIPSVASGAAITGIQMTPLTSMAQADAKNMTNGMTPTNITAANTAVGKYFMVSDILHTQPMNPLDSGSGTAATQDMDNYGMTIAAMSQYAVSIGMTGSSDMITAMISDASDGIMNGQRGSTSITMGGMGGGMMGGSTMPSTAGTSGLATAMSQFIGSTMNSSGLTATDIQMLMDHLNTSNGTIQ